MTREEWNAAKIEAEVLACEPSPGDIVQVSMGHDEHCNIWADQDCSCDPSVHVTITRKRAVQ